MAAPNTAHEKRSERLKVLSGNANLPLSQAICQELNVPLGGAVVRSFSDGEIYVQIDENVRGADVFLIQPTCTPVAHNLLELILMIDALKRASADRITAVLPYFGYARQDRKDQPRVPISAKVVASMIERAGRTGSCRSTCTRRRFKGFLTFRWTICSRRR